MNILKIIGKFLLLLLVTITVIAIALSSSVALGFVYMANTTTPVSQDENNPSQNQIVKTKESINVLILGMNQNLSDFIMLARYNPSTGKVSLLSIPRDTKYNGLNDPSTSYYKMNAVYQNKHIDKIKDKVETMLDVKIDKYLVFDHKALWKLVDAVGGVTVDVPMNMNYDDPAQNLHIHIKKGTQRLDGKDAEGFVRFRKNNDGSGYPGGDIRRIKTQQEFIKSFIKECLKPANILQLPNLAGIMLKDVKTDITLDLILYYLEDIAAFKLDNVTMATLPGTDKTINNISFYILNKNETKKMIDEMFKDVVNENNTEVTE